MLIQNNHCIVRSGSIIDASYEAPIQRNTKEENEQLKQTVVAETFKQNPSKLAQKDIQASLIKKFQELAHV